MPEVKHIIVFKFSELSEKSKEKAVAELCDINVDYDWWNSIYDDAENVNVEIKFFDLYGRNINLRFCNNEDDTAQAILDQHGKGCKTYALAESFVTEYWDTINSGDENKIDFDIPNICAEFKIKLGILYLEMLKNEYEYLQSNPAIIETIEANDYDFTFDGKMFTQK